MNSKLLHSHYPRVCACSIMCVCKFPSMGLAFTFFAFNYLSKTTFRRQKLLYIASHLSSQPRLLNIIWMASNLTYLFVFFLFSLVLVILLRVFANKSESLATGPFISIRSIMLAERLIRSLESRCVSQVASKRRSVFTPRVPLGV